MTGTSLDWQFWQSARTAAEFAEYGIPVTVGSHGVLHGVATIWEALALELGGMPPIGVLRAATVEGARKLGLDGEIGTIAVGKRANLVVLRDDPRESVSHLWTVVGVMTNGIWHQVSPQGKVGGTKPASGGRSAKLGGAGAQLGGGGSAEENVETLHYR